MTPQDGPVTHEPKSETILYTAPGTCGRATAIALYEANIPFQPSLVRFKAREHKAAEFIAKNPRGKAPVLAIDGATLFETVAILNYLNARNPEARLLPEAPDLATEAQHTADLCFCTSTLHPLVSRVRLPTSFAEGEEAVASVYERGTGSMKTYLGIVERRLQERPWWYGDAWSVIDGYIFWVWFRIIEAGFDPNPFPKIADHADRMGKRASVCKALAVEEEMSAQLAAEGMTNILPTVSPNLKPHRQAH